MSKAYRDSVLGVLWQYPFQIQVATMPLKKKRVGSIHEAYCSEVKKTEFKDFEVNWNAPFETKMDPVQTECTTCDVDEDKSKKSKKQKTDIKKAFRNIKNKLTPRKRNKNGVKEISIKPEAETPVECWASEPAVTKKGSGKNGSSSSRSSSANSKNSKLEDVEDLEEDDGIPVVYDAAYQGGD